MDVVATENYETGGRCLLKRLGDGLSLATNTMGSWHRNRSVNADAVKNINEEIIVSKIKWRKQLTVDGGIIDQDHMHLIGIINRFAGIDSGHQGRSQLIEVLLSLRQYAQMHFEREEKLQEKVGYLRSDQQAREHIVLIEQVDGLIQDLKTADDGEVPECSGRIALFLNRWLIDHIIGSDIGMRPYVDQMKSHAASIPALKDVMMI